jgi:hypothetical protein
MLQDPEAVEALLAAALQLLAERGDPRCRGGAFLRLAIRRLGAASARLHGQQPGGVAVAVACMRTCDTGPCQVHAM